MDTVGRQLLNDFSAGQWAVGGEYVAKNADSSRTDVLVQAKFLTPSSIPCNKNRTKERQEQVKVFSCQQVQCATLSPRAHSSSFLHACPFDIRCYQPRTASAYREGCGRRLLRLDATHLFDDVSDARGRAWWLQNEALSTQTQEAKLIDG